MAVSRFSQHTTVTVEQADRGFGLHSKLEAILGRLRCQTYLRMPSRVNAKGGDPFAVRVAPTVVA